MKKEDVVTVIASVLSELQELSGLPASEMSEATRPIGDLEQFDSLSGVEATALLSDRLHIQIPGVSAFVSADGNEARSISENADAVCSIASGIEN